MPADVAARRGVSLASLAWLAVTVVAPLALLTAQAWPVELAEVERVALTRALARGVGLAVVVASIGVGLALLVARTVSPVVILALLLISRAVVAHGVLSLGIAPGPSAAALALIVDVVPFAALLCWLRLRTRPRALIDAAADLGAGPLVRARVIEWPHMRPAVVAAWLWSALQVVGDVVALELAGGGHSYTPGLLIRDALVREQAPGRALVAVLIVVALALWSARLISGELASAARSDWRAPPRPPRALALAGWSVMALMLAGPLALLLGDQPVGFGPVDRQLGELAARSLGIAAVVGALASALGFALALAGRDAGARARTLLGVAMLAPLSIPPAIAGLLSLGVATRVGLGPGPILTALAMLGPGLALGFVAARLSIALVPRALIDAARDLGAGPGDRLRQLWLPLGRPALIVAFVVVFAWVLGQAEIPSFTSGPGGDTLAVGLTIHARAGAMAIVRRWSLVLVVVPVVAAVGLGGAAKLIRRRR
jgi:ABC-type spermidine/putrescine transport system permease subunit II